jgi:hypothetical protein
VSTRKYGASLTSTPSELGQTFATGEAVSFSVNGSEQTGKIEKLLTNSAVVEIDDKVHNPFVNGRKVVSYQQLHKLEA